MRRSQIPAKSFCSVPMSPQFPATPLIPCFGRANSISIWNACCLLPWPGIAGLQHKCQSRVQVNVKPFKLKRGSLLLPSPCLVLGFPVLGTDVHVASVDKSNSCPCLFACSRSMAATLVVCFVFNASISQIAVLPFSKSVSILLFL